MKTPKRAAIAAICCLLAGAAGAENWTFAVSPGGRLEIDLEVGGKISIEGGAKNEVTIVAEVHGRDAAAVRMAANTTAQGVRITALPGAPRRNSFSASADLTITVPDRYDFEISTTGGGIQISGVEGKFSGETMGGNLELRNLRGEASLTTMGGKVDVRDSELSGKVSTMGGDVTFRNVTGGLKGSTMGGQMRVVDGAGGAAEGVVAIETMGGPIDVASAPQGARVKTMGGKIHIVSAREFVEATTMGGEITIEEVDGRVRATTMGGDVTVRMVGAGGEVEIESMSGDLELTLPAGFSGDFDVEIAYTRNSVRKFEIRSEFNLRQESTRDWEYGYGSPRKFIRGKGVTGGGSNPVRLRTVNGDIVIHRAG